MFEEGGYRSLSIKKEMEINSGCRKEKLEIV